MVGTFNQQLPYNDHPRQCTCMSIRPGCPLLMFFWISWWVKAIFCHNLFDFTSFGLLQLMGPINGRLMVKWIKNNGAQLWCQCMSTTLSEKKCWIDMVFLHILRFWHFPHRLELGKRGGGALIGGDTLNGEFTVGHFLTDSFCLWAELQQWQSYVLCIHSQQIHRVTSKWTCMI